MSAALSVGGVGWWTDGRRQGSARFGPNLGRGRTGRLGETLERAVEGALAVVDGGARSSSVSGMLTSMPGK